MNSLTNEISILRQKLEEKTNQLAQYEVSNVSNGNEAKTSPIKENWEKVSKIVQQLQTLIPEEFKGISQQPTQKTFTQKRKTILFANENNQKQQQQQPNSVDHNIEKVSQLEEPLMKKSKISAIASDGDIRFDSSSKILSVEPKKKKKITTDIAKNVISSLPMPPIINANEGGDTIGNNALLSTAIHINTEKSPNESFLQCMCVCVCVFISIIYILQFIIFNSFI